MKPRILIVSLISVCLLTFAPLVFGWGMWGHQHINRAAIFALPEDMRVFFFNHADFITEESTIPDLRKYTLNDKAENPRHFIDLEDYAFTQDRIPKNMKELSEKFDEKTTSKFGILPWYIQEVMAKLTEAFKKNRRNEILFLAADLGHYIADAHMPLHTSTNHDGQLTGQRGVHSFWEAQLPEYFGKTYNFKVNDARYISDVSAATWDIINHSHGLVDTLLKTEKAARQKFTEETLFKKNAAGQTEKNMFGKNVYSYDYATAFHSALNGMVENQMRRSVQSLADFWYTAWVNAGKPDLGKLDSPEVTRRNSKAYKYELKLYRQGKLSGFLPDKEY